MDFRNLTGLPAALSSGSTADREMVYAIACKITYFLEDGGLVPVPADQAWPVFDKPFSYQDVILGPELDVRKQGVDLLVFGGAVAPQRKAVKQLPLTIECGKRKLQFVISGDRTWQKSTKSLVASDPKPFEEMPLAVVGAFGGTAQLNDLPMPHPINPDGRGFYLSADTAEGQPLPNLERADALIRAWDDKPLPACLYKPKGSMLLKFPGPMDEDELLDGMMVTGFNQCVPELIWAPADLGPTLRLSGFAPEGTVVFPLPSGPGPTAHTQTGTRRCRFPSQISTILALVPQRILVVTYLCAFRYLMNPMEKRSVELRWPGDRRVPPPAK